MQNCPCVLYAAPDTQIQKYIIDLSLKQFWRVFTMQLLWNTQTNSAFEYCWPQRLWNVKLKSEWLTLELPHGARTDQEELLIFTFYEVQPRPRPRAYCVESNWSRWMESLPNLQFLTCTLWQSSYCLNKLYGRLKPGNSMWCLCLGWVAIITLSV